MQIPAIVIYIILGAIVTVKREYYNNGHLKYETPHHQGQLHGIAKGWYEDGQLRYEVLCHHGQIHGMEKGWYENGQLQYEVPCHQGRQHGISKWWYESGQFEKERYYLYDEQVTEEEYRKHELIENLACLNK